MDVIHKKNDALKTTKFGKMRLMKFVLDIDCVDCGNVKAITHTNVFRNFSAVFKIGKVTLFCGHIVLAYL